VDTHFLWACGQGKSGHTLLAGPAGKAADVRWAEERFRDTDTQLLWVTPEAHTEALQAFARGEGLTIPRYHDPDGQLTTVLGEWNAHIYYVIDSSGMIRARTHSLTEAVRLLEILSLESRSTA